MLKKKLLTSHSESNGDAVEDPLHGHRVVRIHWESQIDVRGVVDEDVVWHTGVPVVDLVLDCFYLKI